MFQRSIVFPKSWPLKENTFWKNIIVQQTLMCPCKKGSKRSVKQVILHFVLKSM